jgi:NMD protein affecting ribosome stability and mRNA decay
MNAKTTPPGFRAVRRDQLREEREHDSYKLQHKLPEPAVCPECGAFFHAGRWQWGERPSGASEVVCPACHRIRDHFPAGFVHVAGPYFLEHREELTSLIRHHEGKAKADHPLARIIEVEPADDGILVTTTDIHLARDLGEALHHSCQGDLEFHYNEDQKLLRVHWHR